MLKTGRRKSLLAILAGFFGVLALASLSVLNHGFAPPALKAVLAISLGFAFAAAIFAIGIEEAGGREAPADDEDPWVVAEDQVLSYRRSRFVGLGVAEEVADLLAVDPTVSIQEMERLVKRLGCPVTTAVRILWPA